MPTKDHTCRARDLGMGLESKRAGGVGLGMGWKGVIKWVNMSSQHHSVLDLRVFLCWN